MSEIKMQLPKVLSVKNLSVYFSQGTTQNCALNNISFDLIKGKTLGIVGESGSGKSISMLAILKLLTNNRQVKIEGSAYYHSVNNSIDLISAEESVIKNIRGNKISMVFQEPMTSLNPTMSVGKQVTESLILHKNLTFKAAKDECIFWFNKVKLPNPEKLFERYPHELSGGQKQRVMIAMAVCCKPDILIADEPTTALDVTVQKSIVHLITEIQQENNMAVAFISHDLALINQVCDDVMVLYKGEVKEFGNTKEVIYNPQNIYTKALLKCRPSLNSNQIRLPVLSDFLEVEKKEITNSKKDIKLHTSLNILSVENVSIAYQNDSGFFSKPVETVAAKNISFNLYSGKTIGVVGESGSGKSTIAKAITGILKIHSGSIQFNGKNYNKNQKVNFTRKIQMIFQDPYSALNPSIKIGDAIAEIFQTSESKYTKYEISEKVLLLLEKVGLDKKSYEKYPHQFSGGQRQRIVIARALACSPDVLICDESVAALDVSVQAQVLNLLKDLQSENNFGCIFITHDLHVAKFMCDEIIVLKAGEVVEQGKSNEILSSPKNNYTQNLISAVPVI